MLDVSIYSIKSNTHREILSLEDEYLKRMPWKITRFSFDAKVSFRSAIEQKKHESSILLSKLVKDQFIIALDEKGVNMDSNKFAQTLGKFISSAQCKVAFCIGGAYGHSESILQRSNLILSLSNMTFTHKLVQLILIEQIYRAYTIISNHPYHK